WRPGWRRPRSRSARAPAPETIEWYRLACALPARLPAEANLAQDATGRALAARDYALVMGELGPCVRTI
ncbi:MAG: hypothetical protein ACO25F_11250, partial [Erythrobacter sp.]